MQLHLRGDLPFVTASLTYRDLTIEISDVLVDTGAASTILNADLAAEAGIYLDRSDRLRVLRGVGGREFVISIGGILGMDFLRAAGAIIDLCELTLELRGAPERA